MVKTRGVVGAREEHVDTALRRDFPTRTFVQN